MTADQKTLIIQYKAARENLNQLMLQDGTKDGWGKVFEAALARCKMLRERIEAIEREGQEAAEA